MRRILFLIPFVVMISTAEAAYLDLAWSPNQEPDLGGYRVYYGLESRDYIGYVDVGRTTSYRLDNLMDDVPYYIALTAYDSGGNESDFSAEVAGVGSPDEEVPVSGFVADKEGGCFVSALLHGNSPH
jgi:fibronectin type 3 domain-containing protein